MGSINYRTSAYITLGFDLSRTYAAEPWQDEEEETALKCTYLMDAAADILDTVPRDLFAPCTVPGYYEGFSVDLDPDFPLWFDGWQEKQDAQKDLTALRRALLDLVDLGLVAVRPGWCTSYLTPSETRTAVSEAVRRMREDIRRTPTERTRKEVGAC